MAKQDNLYISRFNDYYGVLLTEHQSEMIRLYYDCDMSLFEIAEQFNISRQAVLNSIKRAESLLLEYEQKLKLSEKESSLIGMIEKAVVSLEQKDIEDAKQTLIKLLTTSEGKDGSI